MNFVSEFQIDWRSYKHLSDYVQKNVFWRVVFADAVYLLCMHEMYWLGYMQLCTAMAVGLLCYHIYWHFKRRKEYQKLVESNHGNQSHLVAILDDTGVRTRNLNKDKEFELRLDEIGGALRSKWFVLIFNRDRSNVVDFDTRAMTEGDADALIARLEALGHKPEKLRSIRWLRRMIQIVSVLYILSRLFFGMILTDVSEMPNQNVPAMDVRSSAAALQELGIGGITEEIITEIEGYTHQSHSSVPILLSYVGFGEYDDETWAWTPQHNGVYAVDMEFLEISGMYTDFLTGIEAVSGGELDFENVTENTWIGSDALGIGWKKVSFTLNGKRHTLYPLLTMDWLDLSFPDKLAKIVRQEDLGKELYFLYDEDTVFYIFYCDKAWAEEFEAKTGYELITSIR